MTRFILVTKRTTEVELWDIVETRRKNDNDIGVMYGVMDFDSTEYSSNALSEVVDGDSRNDWILVTRSSIGK